MIEHVHVAPDAAALAASAAAFICDGVTGDAASFAVALSGGGTPRDTYRLLADEPYRSRIPWDRVHWFLVDERLVPADDARSNLRMIREALFSRAPVPAVNIHAIDTSGLDAVRAAFDYETALKLYFGVSNIDPARPLFDVMMLGLGDDGHTASLFPGNPAVQERLRWVVPVNDPSVPEPRISLTMPLIGASRRTAFIIAGEKKRAMFRRLREGDPALPASLVPAPPGGIHAFVDEAVAGDTNA